MMPTSAEPMEAASRRPVDTARIVRLWWPLAASWLLMAVELPMVTAVIARLADPKIQLAAYGSVVLPLAFVVEAPIIMLLAASTALCGDWDSYRKVRRFMMSAGAVLTCLHALVAFTPLFDYVARRCIGVPEEVAEPARLGLRLLTPWTWSIAYRRFQQGVLIRFEHSRPVSIGTGVRLVSNALVLVIGVAHGGIPGAAVAASAVSVGVMAEAVFIGFCVQPVLAERVRPAAPRSDPLTRATFLAFYTPLALTPLMSLLVQPVGAAAISRMPAAMLSLAAWPAVAGLVFLTRSTPLAFNEVVVALLGEPEGQRALNRFTWQLAGWVTLVLAALAITPLGRLWFTYVIGLEPALVDLSSRALWFALPLPAITAYQSWFTGALVHRRRTRAITEAVGLYLAVSTTLLVLGARLDPFEGIHFALAAFVAGGLAQTLWLGKRSQFARAPTA
jgi:progressive ankylosis protein